MLALSSASGNAPFDAALRRYVDFLTADGERFVSVRDDGEGFDGNTTAAGQGLKNIRSRAESIDGGFNLVTRPGFGTALEVVLRT